MFGAIAVGLGGAAVVAGTVVASVAAARYADLDCPNDACGPTLHDDARAYNDLRIPSGVTIAVGALVASVGIVFLVYGATDEQRFVGVEVGPSGLGLRGRF